MHRYNNIEFLMSLDFDEIMGFYLEAKKKNAEERLWQQWLVDYGRWEKKEQFISFENYKKKAFKPKIGKVDKAKVIEKAEKIKAMDQGRR